jgi:hypothetical protein
MNGSYIICSKNIPGQFVLQLDATLDDGNPATGFMRAIRQSDIGGAPSTTATVQANLADSFIVCVSIWIFRFGTQRASQMVIGDSSQIAG